MATSRNNKTLKAVTLALLFVIVASLFYIFFFAGRDFGRSFSICLFLVIIVVFLLTAAVAFLFWIRRKDDSSVLLPPSKEINNCIITLKSISVDAKFTCPADCRYFQHEECYWAQNSHIHVSEHNLEGIIVFFNLSYSNQDPPFFFYPGSVILRDNNNVEHVGVSLCDRISKIGSWGRHCLVNTQENLYVFFPKLGEGASIDAIRFLGLGKQKGFVEFSSSEVHTLLHPFSDFISTDIMDLRLGPLYSLRSKISESDDGLVREGLTLILELYEKQLLSRYEVDKILKGLQIEQSEVR